MTYFQSALSQYADVPKDFFKTKEFSYHFKNDLSAKEFQEFEPLFKTIQTPYEKIILEYDRFSDEELDISFLNDIIQEVESSLDLITATAPSNTTDSLMEMERTLLDPGVTNNEMLMKSTEAIRLLRLKLNMSRRLLKVLYKVIRFTYFIFTRISRTAYCMYSHIPDYSEAVLDGKNHTVQCFKEAKSTSAALVKEVSNSIEEVIQSAIRSEKNVKKCIKRKSIWGKRVVCLRNINKIANEIKESKSNFESAIAMTIDNAPAIVDKLKQCEVASFQKMIFNLNVAFLNMVKCIVYPLFP